MSRANKFLLESKFLTEILCWSRLQYFDFLLFFYECTGEEGQHFFFYNFFRRLKLVRKSR
ncbi:hypothetical protein C1645_747567, partial [Glomus cerebriforme]